MSSRRLIVGVMLLGLALPLASCASGKLKLSASKMCQAHGGTYNTATQSCSYTASTRSAKQTCEQHGGNYDTAAQVCEIGME